MTYVGNNYTAADMSPVAIDIIVTIFSVLASLGTLIGLVLLFKWIKGHKVL